MKRRQPSVRSSTLHEPSHDKHVVWIGENNRVIGSHANVDDSFDRLHRCWHFTIFNFRLWTVIGGGEHSGKAISLWAPSD